MQMVEGVKAGNENIKRKYKVRGKRREKVFIKSLHQMDLSETFLYKCRSINLSYTQTQHPE